MFAQLTIRAHCRTLKCEVVRLCKYKIGCKVDLPEFEELCFRFLENLALPATFLNILFSYSQPKQTKSFRHPNIVLTQQIKFDICCCCWFTYSSSYHSMPCHAMMFPSQKTFVSFKYSILVIRLVILNEIEG